MVMLSSMKLTPATVMGRDETRKVKTILQILMDRNEAVGFLAPVDWKGLNLTDYTFIIKNPMDLGTVQTKVQEEKYRWVEEALDDIQLIWDNCKTYNPVESWIYREAEALERHFKKMVRNYLPAVPITVPGRHLPAQADTRRHAPTALFEEDPDELTSYHAKLAFAESLKHLSPEQLGHVVQLLFDRCPSAVIQENDHAQMHVDQIDPDLFAEISLLLTTFNDEYQKDRLTKKNKL